MPPPRIGPSPSALPPARPAATPAPVNAPAAAPVDRMAPPRPGATALTGVNEVQAAGARAPLLPIDPSVPARPDEIIVGTWSAENLFDTADDPNTDDREFLPGGNAQYSEEKLKAHIDGLSRVVRSINGGRGPDIMAITEIENPAVGERLRSEGLGDLGYQKIALVEGPDARGVDQALLTRYPVIGEPKLHPVVREDGKVYRGILEVNLDVNGSPLTVFVNHWYAMRVGMDPEKTHQQRMVAANVLKGLVDGKLAEDPGREIVLLGDFNAGVGDRAFSDGLKAAPTAAEAHAGKALYDTMESVKELNAASPDVQLGTHYYHPGQSWSTFDHALVSHTLLDGSGLAWVPGSTAVVKNGVTADAAGIPRRFFQPRIEGQAPGQIDPLGASDHFPVVMRLRKVGDEARRPVE